MSHIVYGVAGEGVGHSIRAISIIPGLLKSNHKITLLVGKQSKIMLEKEYGNNQNVEIVSVPLPSFYYNKKNNLSMFMTLASFLFNWGDRRRCSIALKKKLASADVFISDYEPITSWTAFRLKKPLITLSSQNFYIHADIKLVPFYYWLFFLFIRFSGYWFGLFPDISIVSHYEQSHITRNLKRVKYVGPFIRESIRTGKRQDLKSFVLVYINPSVESYVVSELLKSNKKFKVYGLGKKAPNNNVEYFDTNSELFVKDLLKCEKVICTAGTTLTSECLYLRIPMLLIPIPNQKEQGFNSYLLSKLGVESVWNKKESHKISKFLAFNQQVDFPIIPDGSVEALQIIESFCYSLRNTT